MIHLTWTVTQKPDLGGWKFFVEFGQAFAADDYAEAYSLNPHELNPRDVHAAQDAAARLGALANGWK
jgi:hypothetical protein